MPRKRHNMDRYEALGCTGCVFIVVASIILLGFMAWGILFIMDIKRVLGV